MMTCSVSAEVQTSAYRSIPASASSRDSARAIARWPSGGTGQLVGSAYHRNSCRRSIYTASRQPPSVSQRRAVFASPASGGSSRASVSRASPSVIMRPVCPTIFPGGRRVADLATVVRTVAGHYRAIAKGGAGTWYPALTWDFTQYRDSGVGLPARTGGRHEFTARYVVK